MNVKPAVIALLMVSCTSQQFQDTLQVASESLGNDGTAAGLTNMEVISGLKQALELGAKRTVNATSVTDGFNKNQLIRIPFPEEAIKIKNTLNDIGMSSLVEDFEVTLNRAAEEASKEAVPVFVDAITNMSIGDGFEILNGGEGAATRYLREKTSANLVQRFRPVVEKATDKVELTKHWEPLTSAYNSTTFLSGGNAVDPDLNGYVTDRAIDGLFMKISEEENKIRQDPVARTTDLLKRVFGQQQ